MPAEPRLVLTFLDDWNIPTGTRFDAGLVWNSGGARGALSNESTPTIAELRRRKASGDFGGLSALDFDAATGTVYALSDSSAPVIFTFAAAIDGGQLQMRALERLELTDSDGTPIPRRTLDPEGIALGPDGGLFIASEGYTGQPPYVDPALLEFDRHGVLLGQLPMPGKFRHLESPAGPLGVRPNAGFESLTVTADGSRLFTAIESPLYQDAPACGTYDRCPVRMLEYGRRDGRYEALHEYVYPVDAMPLPAHSGHIEAVAGLAELLLLEDDIFDEDILLALERGFGVDDETGASYQSIRIFEVDLREATGVSAIDSLDAAPPYRMAEKRLLLDFDDVVAELEPEFASLDNFEGMTLGPRLADGGHTLLLVSDNNYQQRQRTAWFAFRIGARDSIAKHLD